MLASEKAAIATPATGLLIFQTDAVSGFYYYNGTIWVLIGGGAGTTETASNGLTKTVNDIQLGGNLTANTTVTQDAAESLTIANNGTANTIINLQNTGDFDVQDNGATALFVGDNANVGVGTNAPVSKLAVNGGTTIGTAYAGTVANAAPTNGLRVEGQTIINKANSQDTRDVFSSHTSAAAYNNVIGYPSVTATRAIAGYAAANGMGVFGFANRTGYGVVGTTQSGTMSAFAQTGEGVYGQADGATGVTVIPIGVHGMIDETVAGLRTATAVIGENNNITRGNGFTGGAYATVTAQSVAGVYGNIGTRGALSGDNGYMFGVIGDIVVVSGAIPDGSGGVLGSSGSGSFGMLGYKGLASTIYSVYGGGTSASIAAGNTGNRQSETLDVNNHIGLGITGGFMGGYVKGNQYGLVTRGDEFGLYVQGKTITKEPVATIIETNNTKEVLYNSISQSVDVSTRGKGNLQNGEAYISFNNSFKNVVSENEDINITVTPMSETNGVYVSEITAKGFYVKENKNGNSNATFFWTATGIQNGYEKGIEISKTILNKDFDKNIDGVMNNDGILQEGTPIYFDGKEIKFEVMPAKFFNETKKALPKN